MSLRKAIVGSLTFSLLSFGSALVARATAVTIAAADTGWYQDDDHHSLTNYIASLASRVRKRKSSFQR